MLSLQQLTTQQTNIQTSNQLNHNTDNSFLATQNRVGL